MKSGEGLEYLIASILPLIPHCSVLSYFASISTSFYTTRHILFTMEAVKRFFSSPRFAVAGASNDSHKFGYKRTNPPNAMGLCILTLVVLAWYHQHSLPVTPLNPRSPSIQLSPAHSYDTVASPRLLSSPSQTSLSVVTPPAVTLPLLQEAHSVGIPAVWLQPGTFDNAVLDFARSHFEAVIAGDGGRGSEGWCVLVDGEEGLDAAGVNWTSQRL